MVESTLRNIKPVTYAAKIPVLKRYPALIGLLAPGLMACVYIANDKLIVATSGILLIFLMIWSFLKIRSSKNTDDKIKKIR